MIRAALANLSLTPIIFFSQSQRKTPPWARARLPVTVMHEARNVTLWRNEPVYTQAMTKGGLYVATRFG